MGRITNAVDAISKFDPKWTMQTVTQVDATMNSDKIQGAFEAYLNAHKGLHHLVLYTPLNDNQALAALAALKATGREADAIIVANGGDIQARPILADCSSPFKMSIGYFPDQYGARLAPMVTAILAGTQTEKAVYTNHQPITCDNVKTLYPNG